MNTTRVYVKCEICGRQIAKCGMHKHMRMHENGGYKTTEPRYHLDHDGLNCKFCNKEFQNKNALIQHEIRCPQNPDRTCYDYLAKAHPIPKGATKETCPALMKQVETMRRKIESGYVYHRAKHVVNYIYKDHNYDEIQKWVNFVSCSHVDIPNYEVYPYDGYQIIKDRDLTREYNTKYGTSTILLEHIYLMSLLLGDNFNKGNVVHHVDENKSNNELRNLLVFDSVSDHVRFHNADDAYLIYDESTHRFECIRADVVECIHI